MECVCVCAWPFSVNCGCVTVLLENRVLIHLPLVYYCAAAGSALCGHNSEIRIDVISTHT